MGETPTTFSNHARERIGESVQFTEGLAASGVGRPSHLPRPTNQTVTDTGGVSLVVVRVRDWGSNAKTIKVATVEPAGDGVVRFELDADGKLKEQTIFVHPGAARSFYAAFAQTEPNDTIGPSTRILKAYRWRDGWYLEQTLLFGFPLQDKAFRIEGCLPVVAE